MFVTLSPLLGGALSHSLKASQMGWIQSIETLPRPSLSQTWAHGLASALL